MSKGVVIAFSSVGALILVFGLATLWLISASSNVAATATQEHLKGIEGGLGAIDERLAKLEAELQASIKRWGEGLAKQQVAEEAARARLVRLESTLGDIKKDMIALAKNAQQTFDPPIGEPVEPGKRKGASNGPGEGVKK